MFTTIVFYLLVIKYLYIILVNEMALQKERIE